MSAKKTPKIAVLAVHGVADQAAKETARKAAGLLLGERLIVDYENFTEKEIFISLRNIKLSSKVELHEDESTFRMPSLSETVSQAVSNSTQSHLKASRAQSDSCQETSIESSCDQFEHKSMSEQIQGFKPSSGDFVLDTVVLEGRRRCAQDDDLECKVDIYESHWADLSRMKNGFFTVFFEFYLFLFFFSRVGGITIERVIAQVSCHKDWWSDTKKWEASIRTWRLSQKLHWYAENALVIGVPITSLAILSLAVSGAPFLVHYYYPDATGEQMHSYFRALSIWEIGTLVTLVLFISGYAFGKSFPLGWAGLFFTICLISGLVIGFVASKDLDVRTFVFLTWLLFSIPLLAIMHAYDKRRTGAFLFSIISFSLTGLVLLYFLVRSSDKVSMESVFIEGINATKLVIALNIVAWLIFLVGAILSSMNNWLAVRSLPKEQRVMGRRSVLTIDLSLILPGTVIMLLTFSLWQMVLKLSETVMLEGELQTLQKLIDQNILPYLAEGLAVLGVGIAFSLWMISPAFVFSKCDESKKRSLSSWVGNVLSDAFNKMRGTGELLRFLLLVAIPVAWFYRVYSCWESSNDVVRTCWAPGTDERNIILFSGLLMVFLLFGSKGPFQFLALGFRAGLDIALDIANWLRIQPRESNPRAAICRRYVSLLRHIAEWTDPNDKQGYDGLIIVAHSQGTVITAELLRFLKYENVLSNDKSKDSALARYFSNENKLPIYLLTFGCPLRQLYNRRFPLQFEWSGERQANGYKTLGPDPDTLGLQSWSNLYCSGDYVGRDLWYRDTDKNRWKITWSDEGKKLASSFANSREKCLGVGGHTGYWSGDYPDVAIEMDRLSCTAASTTRS